MTVRNFQVAAADLSVNDAFCATNRTIPVN
jgi:hypothetical protein